MRAVLLLRGVERRSPCSLEVVQCSFIMILRSLCKNIYILQFLFFLFSYSLRCTLAFLPSECQLFHVKQINNLNNLMTQNTRFTLNRNCAADPLVCHLSNGNNYKLSGETSQVFSVPLEFLTFRTRLPSSCYWCKMCRLKDGLFNFFQATYYLENYTNQLIDKIKATCRHNCELTVFHLTVLNCRKRRKRKALIVI